LRLSGDFRMDVVVKEAGLHRPVATVVAAKSSAAPAGRLQLTARLLIRFSFRTKWLGGRKEKQNKMEGCGCYVVTKMARIRASA
jgi:hypothetical protein